MLIVDTNMTTSLKMGSKVNIVDYLSPLGFTSQAKQIRIESGEEILFLQYYSGGAHCCIVYESFTYDSVKNVYRFLDQFYCEECFGELTYPIPFFEWMDYFYCAFAYGSPIPCPNDDYSTFMHFMGGKFEAKTQGNIKVLEKCFIDFCKSSTFPELYQNGNDDDGTRESVLNLLYQIYTLGPDDIANVKNLYFGNFPSTKDKKTLWGEIENSILSNRIKINRDR